MLNYPWQDEPNKLYYVLLQIGLPCSVLRTAKRNGSSRSGRVPLGATITPSCIKITEYIRIAGIRIKLCNITLYNLLNTQVRESQGRTVICRHWYRDRPIYMLLKQCSKFLPIMYCKVCLACQLNIFSFSSLILKHQTCAQE